MKIILFVLCTHALLAQTPVRSDSVNLSRNYSTLLVNPSAQQYNFYYSAKQAYQYQQTSTASYTQQDRIKKNHFRGKLYTEAVEKGLKEPTSFNDYVLIGSGTINEVKTNGEWE